MAQTRDVGRQVRTIALVRRRAELDQLEAPVAVRSFHHREVHLYALERHDALYPATFDGPLALRLESELDEEFDRSCEVVDHDANVVHPLDSHVALEGRQAR